MAESLITIDSEDVNKIVKDAFREDSEDKKPFLIVETMEECYAKPVLGMSHYVIIDAWKPAEWNLNNYPSGRVFDDTGELKWQKQGALFRMVYIGAQPDKLPIPNRQEKLEPPKFSQKVPDQNVYLWGEKVTKEKLQDEMGFEEDEEIFVELQIPQYLKYPVNISEGRVKMVVREFYDQSGRLVYFRFVNMFGEKNVNSEK
jgi:hypothetical protein